MVDRLDEINGTDMKRSMSIIRVGSTGCTFRFQAQIRRLTRLYEWCPWLHLFVARTTDMKKPHEPAMKRGMFNIRVRSEGHAIGFESVSSRLTQTLQINSLLTHVSHTSGLRWSSCVVVTSASDSAVAAQQSLDQLLCSRIAHVFCSG